jgi:hypothetical protein
MALLQSDHPVKRDGCSLRGRAVHTLVRSQTRAADISSRRELGWAQGHRRGLDVAADKCDVRRPEIAEGLSDDPRGILTDTKTDAVFALPVLRLAGLVTTRSWLLAGRRDGNAKRRFDTASRRNRRRLRSRQLGDYSISQASACSKSNTGAPHRPNISPASAPGEEPTTHEVFRRTHRDAKLFKALAHALLAESPIRCDTAHCGNSAMPCGSGRRVLRSRRDRSHPLPSLLVGWCNRSPHTVPGEALGGAIRNDTRVISLNQQLAAKRDSPLRMQHRLAVPRPCRASKINR